MQNSSAVICICFWWADYAREAHTWENTMLLHLWTQWQARCRAGKGELETERHKLGMTKKGRTSYRTALLQSELLVAFKEKKAVFFTESPSYASRMGDASNSNKEFRSFWLGTAKYEKQCRARTKPFSFMNTESVNCEGSVSFSTDLLQKCGLFSPVCREQFSWTPLEQTAFLKLIPCIHRVEHLVSIL